MLLNKSPRRGRASFTHFRRRCRSLGAGPLRMGAWRDCATGPNCWPERRGAALERRAGANWAPTAGAACQPSRPSEGVVRVAGHEEGDTCLGGLKATGAFASARAHAHASSLGCGRGVPPRAGKSGARYHFRFGAGQRGIPIRARGMRMLMLAHINLQPSSLPSRGALAARQVALVWPAARRRARAAQQATGAARVSSLQR